MDRMGDRADVATAGQHVDQRVEVAPPRIVESDPVLDRHVREGDRRVGDTGAAVAVDFAGNVSVLAVICRHLTCSYSELPI